MTAVQKLQELINTVEEYRGILPAGAGKDIIAIILNSIDEIESEEKEYANSK